MSVLPIKLGILMVRTIAKPFAARLKSTAKTTPFLSKACFHVGQISHNVISRINVRLLGHKIKTVKPLGEAEAVESGANFMSESFIYSVSAGAILFEVVRSDAEKERKAQEKRERQRAKEERWQRTSHDFSSQVGALRKETAELRKLVEDLREKNEQAARKRWSWL